MEGDGDVGTRQSQTRAWGVCWLHVEIAGRLVGGEWGIARVLCCVVFARIRRGRSWSRVLESWGIRSSLCGGY